MRKYAPYKVMLVVLLLVLTRGVNGQINTFSDQYLANLFLLNPAVAGTGQYSNLTLTSNQQWVGWDGAPASQSVTYHTRWSKSKDRFNPLGFINKGKNTFSNVGVGAGFFHESYGVFQMTGFHLDYSYHIYSRRGRLSFGLAPTIYHIGSSSLVVKDPNDPYLANPVKSNIIDFNAGVHYFNKTMYAGFSIIQLTNSVAKFGNYGFPEMGDPSLNPELARTVYGYYGYFFELDKGTKLKVEPMGLVRYNAVNGLGFDVSGTVHLLDKFNAGVSYSFKRGISVFTGIRLDNLSIRYIFEIPVSNDITAKYGTSHLIQLSLNVGQPIK